MLERARFLVVSEVAEACGQTEASVEDRGRLGSQAFRGGRGSLTNCRFSYNLGATDRGRRMLSRALEPDEIWT